MFETILNSLEKTFSFILELLNKVLGLVESIEEDETASEPLDTEHVKRRR